MDGFSFQKEGGLNGLWHHGGVNLGIDGSHWWGQQTVGDTFKRVEQKTSGGNKSFPHPTDALLLRNLKVFPEGHVL